MPRDNETLSSLFSPPRGDLHGIGGVLCALSADAEFLEQALLRFTRVPPSSRIARGSVDLTLMLDPAHAAISPDQVAGLQMLRPKSRAQRPWPAACMHAKVGLLAFGPARTGDPTWYRLLVATGNWTTASARHQIEMVWYLDISLGASAVEDLHELYAGAGFLRNLMRCYQSGPLLTQKAEQLLAFAAAKGVRPEAPQKLRFLSTIPWDADAAASEGLWTQLSRRLSEDGVTRNYLVCGSGFYEQQRDPAEQPQVLHRIVNDLARTRPRALTDSAERRLVANGEHADQVMASYRAGGLAGWELCRPKDPVAGKSEARAQLHAKFLFAARRRQDALTSGVLYLGSGNLSIKGFLLPTPQGNIEAGVVLPVPEIDSTLKLNRTLPIGTVFRDKEIEAVEVEEKEPEPAGADLPPSPIRAFQILPDGSLGIDWDEAVSTASAEIIVYPLAGPPVPLLPGQPRLSLEGGQVPRCIEVRWDGHTCMVPCLDVAGEFKRQSIPTPTFESWLDQLRCFPETWNDPDPEKEGTDDPEEVPERRAGGTLAPGGTGEEMTLGRDFPAHTAMMLVEAIAERNGSVLEEQAADWIHYLRHLLIEQQPTGYVEGWRSLDVNFLHALLSPEGFAPAWTDLDGYRALIAEVTRAWGLNESCTLDVGAGAQS